jgi:primosomal protein N' (replication factor Y)
MMMNERLRVAKIALSSPFHRLFDYLVPDDIDGSLLRTGSRVIVPFKNRDTIGIFLKITDKSEVQLEKLKSIKTVIDDEPIIPNALINLCQWASDYYHYPFGEVLFTTIPKYFRQGKTTTVKVSHEKKLSNLLKTNENFNVNREGNLKDPQKLNPEQQQAFLTIMNHLTHFQCFLLNGVTGSGKTEVYLQVIDQILKNGKQALVLIPEISLTPQTLDRFKQRFHIPIVALHSSLTHRERSMAWMQTQSNQAKIVIGTRSAVFTPFQNLGMIVIDEEHDLSFKQQDRFRYSARDLAIVRANMENIPIVLGSATPSFETLHNVQAKRYQVLHLPERAGNAIHPNYHIIDIRNESLKNGLSQMLLKMMDTHLQQNSQVLLFLNRRGYAPTLMCHQCGFTAKCKRCDVNLTLHKQPQHLRCHHCNTVKSIIQTCPVCGNKHLQNIGVGTERLEHELKKHFPDIPITRIDRDTTRRKNAMQDLLNHVQQDQKQILIGTQMIAKGHHFPNVTLVGIINLDAGFFGSDFRTIERTAQLLIQVAGRSGRAEKPGDVFIQTHYPNHSLLLQLIQQGYNQFALSALKERQESQLPPYTHFVLFRAEANNLEKSDQFLKELKELGIYHQLNSIKFLGPIPAPMPKCKGRFRAQLLVHSKNRRLLHELLNDLICAIETLKSAKRVRWSIDVDPLEMN